MKGDKFVSLSSKHIKDNEICQFGDPVLKFLSCNIKIKTQSSSNFFLLLSNIFYNNSIILLRGTLNILQHSKIKITYQTQ